MPSVLAALALALALAPLPAPPVPEGELDTMRGGIALPGGIDLKLSVLSDTRVDGRTVLRTVFRADAGAPSLQVFTGDGSAAAAASVGPAVTVTRGGRTEALSTAGLNEVVIAPGQAVDTAAGRVRVDELARGARVNLAGEAIDVSHLVGEGLGSVVANTADGRVIDTLTTVNIDLSGVAPGALGSALLRVDGLALEATRAGVR